MVVFPVLIVLGDGKRSPRSPYNPRGAHPPGYLCKITDNVYGIDFTAFKLRDLDHNTTLFEVCVCVCVCVSE